MEQLKPEDVQNCDNRSLATCLSMVHAYEGDAMTANARTVIAASAQRLVLLANQQPYDVRNLIESGREMADDIVAKDEANRELAEQVNDLTRKLAETESNARAAQQRLVDQVDSLKLETDRLKSALTEANAEVADSDRALKLARADLQRRVEAENEDGARWFWQTDGDNYLEGLVDNVQVIIGAKELRDLILPKREPEAKPAQLPLTVICDVERLCMKLAGDMIVTPPAHGAAWRNGKGDQPKVWRLACSLYQDITGIDAWQVAMDYDEIPFN